LSKSNQVHEMFRKTPKGERYKVIWRMIKRYYSAFKKINEGSSAFPLSEFDIAQSFFIYCYHLKDWLNNDLDIEKEVIDKLISENPELQYCADLCNGFKHLVRNGSPRRNSQPDLKEIIVCLSPDGKKIRGRFFIISTDQGEGDAFGLASKCLNIWYKFIKKYDKTISLKTEFEAYSAAARIQAAPGK